jgi:hypothetical protein
MFVEMCQTGAVEIDTYTNIVLLIGWLKPVIFDCWLDNQM